MKRFDYLKISAFRAAAGMTQEALAIAMSTPTRRVHKEQISEWERGTGGLTVGTLVRLCAALQRQPNDFFVEVKK